MDIQQHELFQLYLPEEGSKLYWAMMSELEARSQRSVARQALQERTQELRLLMCQRKQFNSLTPVEEVMEVQARMEALRWLITCIEREMKMWDEACQQRAQQVQALWSGDDGATGSGQQRQLSHKHELESRYANEQLAHDPLAVGQA